MLVDLDSAELRIGDVAVAEGDIVSINGTTGEVVAGEVEVVAPEPLHEFLPDLTELLAKEASGDLDEEGRTLLDAARGWDEENAMLGTRGVRLGIARPGLYQMQVRALMEAAGWVSEAAEEALGGADLERELGVMIETPRAGITAGAIAEHACFFSFGTNDLTQMTFGFSRDVAARVVQPYLDRGVLDADPFVTIDADGVGFLLRHAAEQGRAAREGLELGVCGEHGADPVSVALRHDIGLDYVSCSPYRVPVARLTAARAALSEGA